MLTTRITPVIAIYIAILYTHNLLYTNKHLGPEI